MTDRELDALVAEKVMGWKRCTTTSMPGWWTTPNEACWTCDVPTYSTDISAAFEVVEEMRKRGFRAIVDGSATITENPWYAVFGHADLRSGARWDTTAPRAICLAALRALGVEVPA